MLSWRPTATSLLEFSNAVIKAIADRFQRGVVYTEISKAILAGHLD